MQNAFRFHRRLKVYANRGTTVGYVHYDDQRFRFRSCNRSLLQIHRNSTYVDVHNLDISETNYSDMTKCEIPASFTFAVRFVTLECYDEQLISTPWCSSDRETVITDRGLVPSASNGQQYWIDSGVTGFETSDKTMRAISRESKCDGCSRS